MSLLEPTEELKQKYFARVPKAEIGDGIIFPGLVTSHKKILSLADVELGPTDIVISTYPKSGTIWSSEAVSAIAHEGDLEAIGTNIMYQRVPRLELDNVGLVKLSELPPAKPTPAKCRVFNTHVHAQFLPKSILEGKAKLLYVVRNPKDTAVSYFHYHHMALFLTNETDLSWDEFFPLFCSGYLCGGSWFKHAIEYWKLAQKHDNIKFIFFEDMKKDLLKVVEDLEGFVGVPLTEEQRKAVVYHCSFNQMKDNKMTNRDDGGHMMAGGAKFMRKGIVGDWKNYFTVAQNEQFEALYKKELEGTGLNFEFK